MKANDTSTPIEAEARPPLIGVEDPPDQENQSEEIRAGESPEEYDAPTAT